MLRKYLNISNRFEDKKELKHYFLNELFNNNNHIQE